MYPDYVLKYKKPGFKIIKRNEQFYLYKTTSKRIKGFKNPQAVNVYIGIIKEEGLIKAKTRVKNIFVYEYGLCSYLLNVGNDIFGGYANKVIIKAILITIYGIKITKYHFMSSYLSIIFTDFKFDHVMDVDRELASKLARYINYDEYNKLLEVKLVLINNKRYISNLNEENIKILRKYNISEEL